MKEHSIMMSAEMVKAILDGRKTMTRRTGGLNKINENPNHWFGIPENIEEGALWRFNNYNGSSLIVKCPYQIGDRLWVKETWAEPFNRTTDKDSETPLYKADIYPSFLKCYKWKPSIFMPRWASRITLLITEVKTERVQEISHSPFDQDCHAEGFNNPSDLCLNDFMQCWNSLNAKRGYGWEKNPWVWVIGFRTDAVRVS